MYKKQIGLASQPGRSIEKFPIIYSLGNLREYSKCIAIYTIYFTTSFTR